MLTAAQRAQLVQLLARLAVRAALREVRGEEAVELTQGTRRVDR
jgi:hypothetical protein